MTGNRNDDIRSKNPSIHVRSDWSVGPRTDAWDRLWREILGGLGTVPPADAREALESEVGDA
jgi:hypothetical protein